VRKINTEIRMSG